MIDSNSKHRGNDPAATGSRWTQRGVVGAACVLVIGIYAVTAWSGAPEAPRPTAADTYYNLLVQGFQAGQLNVKKDVPPGLAQLVDPYDPAANGPYQDSPYWLHDMSYYQGKLYLYWGGTPALMLLWPVATLTGHYLFDRQAVGIFCTVGFLVSMGLLRALWRRYFAEVSVGVVAAATLALGLAPFTPFLLARCDVYEVSISCGYAFTMVALAAMWKALHEPERRGRWLAAASLAYGLVVGARPNLLFGAIILLVPVALAWRERRKVWASLLAAVVPITIIGVGLMLYNFLRFDNPLEFGMRYQLTPLKESAMRHFSLDYLWFNLRLYFWQPAHWSSWFPFVHGVRLPPFPVGHGNVEPLTFGVLTNIPLVWLALAVPLAWRRRSGQSASILRWFVRATVLLFGVCALTMCLFRGGAMRYAVDFLPALVLLAVIGILGLERALVPPLQLERSVSRCAVRWGWGILLGFSVAFSLLVSVKRCAESHYNLAVMLQAQGKVPEAVGQLEQALRINPDYAEAHHDLGVVLKQQGKTLEAMAQFEQALRLNPGYAQAHFDFGNVLIRQNKVPEAIAHYEQAVRLNPDYADAHNNLGLALWQTGKVPEAMAHYEQALRIQPNYADAHYNLGALLKDQGKVPEAMAHYEQALRLNPDYAEAHCNLGATLAQAGRIPEAIGQLEQALRLKPDLAEAHNNLGNALLQLGRSQEAIAHYEQALRLKPDYAEARDNLENVRLQAGKLQEAIGRYEQALRLKPENAEAHNDLAIALVRLGRMQEAMGHWEQALRINPDDAKAHYNLGVALKDQGKVPEAIAHYEEALRLQPDFAEAHYALGIALEQAGRTREAIGHYEQALRIKPDFAQAQNRLARLQSAQ